MKAISEKYRVFVLSLFASGALWGAPMPVLDFETPEERACVQVHATHGIFGPMEGLSCAGAWSLAYCPKPWEKGLDEWPSMTLTVPEGRRDWSVFDHLSIDLLSCGEGCDVFKCFIVGPDGPVQKGFRAETTLPPRGWKRWQIPLARIREKVKPGDIARIHFFTTRPRDCRVYIDNLQLVRQTEALAQPDTAFWKALMAECEARRKAAAAEATRQRAARNAALRAEAAAANRCADAFLLASATAMEKVRPQDAGRFRSAARLAVRLARNECEAVQLLVTPAAAALKNVRVAIGPLTLEGAPSVAFPAANVTASPVGYVKTSCEPPYVVYPGPHPAEAGWWPVSLLYDRGVKRVAHLPIAGVLWYQGESNATTCVHPDVPLDDDYMLETNLAVIEQLRGNRKIPFVMMGLPKMNRPWAPYRAAQKRACDEAGAIYVDTFAAGLGDPNDVHPRDKIPFAALACASLKGSVERP